MDRYFVKIKDGVPHGQRMHADDWPKYSEIVFDDGETECPEGFLPVHKMLPRPEPGPNQRLAWTYTPVDGEMVKDYYLETTYSTSGLIYALMERGVYEQCRAWMEERGVRDLVLSTKEFTDGLAYFNTIKQGLQALLGYTDEQVADVLAQAEIGGGA